VAQRMKNGKKRWNYAGLARSWQRLCNVI